MSIKVGDYVCVTEDPTKAGTVTNVTGSSVTFRTARGAYFTVASATLEVKAGGTYSKFAPDAMELAANTVAFAGSQMVRKRKAFGEPTMRFVAEDALYEFILKGFMRDKIESYLSSTMHNVVAADDAGNFTSADIKDALAKTVSIGLLDTVYKLLMKGRS